MESYTKYKEINDIISASVKLMRDLAYWAISYKY